MGTFNDFKTSTRTKRKLIEKEVSLKSGVKLKYIAYTITSLYVPELNHSYTISAFTHGSWQIVFFSPQFSGKLELMVVFQEAINRRESFTKAWIKKKAQTVTPLLGSFLERLPLVK